MSPAEFLTLLWGARPPGLIAVWRLADKTSSYLLAPAGAGGLDGATDVYVGVATTARDRGRKNRPTAAHAAAVAGLWLDIDVDGGPDEKAGAAPDVATAIALADFELPPTLIVHSGYGVHAWWLFNTPWVFRAIAERDQAAQASAQWFELHRRRARAQGFGVDHAHDLARILRPPGTVNGKGGRSAPVTVLRDDRDRRYPRETLLDRAATAGPVLAVAPAGRGGEALGPVDVQPAPGAAPPRAMFEALLANSDEFARTWQHDRPEHRDWSASEYDLALCSLAAQAGWTDQQLADLIAYHRSTGGEGTEKGQRLDYLRRTIGKARAGTEQRRALEDVGALIGRAA